MTATRKKRTNWPAVAAALASAVPPSLLHPAAMARAGRAVARAKRGPAATERWAVAFSGGADSLALLLLLWSARGEGRKPGLVALHFDHRLRGAASTADARFCQDVCRALRVPCVLGRWAAVSAGASEAEARAARHEFFAREMRRRGLKLLWLAHHQDDVAETMLMRLSRGSGAGGMSAPRPVQELPDERVHLRPLLTLKKSELVEALRRAGAVWREDASNRQGRYFRNRIRREVLPAWQRAAGRDALAGAGLTRDLLEEDDRALEMWVDQLKPIKRSVLDARALQGFPRAVLRRALHRWLLAVRPDTDLSRQGFALLLAVVEKGSDTRFSLGRSGFAVLRSGKLAFKNE